MPTILPIPATPDELTPDWLSAALRAGGCNLPPISHFTIAPLSANKGFYGQLVRLTLDYAPAADTDEAAHSATAPPPATLIAKFSSANPAMRQRAVDSYLREVRFYQQLAPHSDLPTPHCYYADIDTQSGNHLLLLQELAPAHPITRVSGCTPAQARLALLEIAKLHRRWWGRTDDPALAWLPDPPPPDAAALRTQYDQWWPLFYEKVTTTAKDQLPADLVEPSRTLGKDVAAIRTHIFHRAPRTLIHRDYQLDNLIFDGQVGAQGESAQNSGAQNSRPQRGEVRKLPLAILDWQFLSRGCGVWDVAYFLAENLQGENLQGGHDGDAKAQLARELLAIYHLALCEGDTNGQGMEGSQGIGEGYGFDECRRDFRLALLQRHVALVATIAAMPFSAEQQHIHLNVLLPRNIAALRAHEAFGLLG